MSVVIEAIGLLTERIENQKKLFGFFNQKSLDVTKNCVLEQIEVYRNKRYFKKLDISSQMALIAVEQLGVMELTEDAGIFIGNNFAGWGYVESQLKLFYQSGEFNTINPFVATAWFPTAAQGEVSIAHKLLGYSKTFALDELSGGIALYHAYIRLKENKLKFAIAGGTESVHFQLVHDYISSVCESRYPEYVPVDAACFIRLEKEVSKGTGKVGIVEMAIGTSFEEALLRCWHADKESIDYCIMPVVSGHYTNSQLRQDLNTLERVTKKSISFGSPQVKIGNTVSASFPFALACANEILQMQKLPHVLISARFIRQILVVGKSYTGIYLCALLKN